MSATATPAPADLASADMKSDLRTVTSYMREHETNPVIMRNFEAALEGINGAVANRQPITRSLVAATWIAIMNATNGRSATFHDALSRTRAAAEKREAGVPVTAPAEPRRFARTTPPAAPASAPEARSTGITRPRFDNVPEGRYAFVNEAGHVAFAKVVHRTYTSGTYAFANLLVGAPGEWNESRLSRDAGAAVLAKIAADIEGAAKLFGTKTETCTFCGSPLSHLQSRASGYGRYCASKHGLPYTSRAEAEQLLAEGKISADGLEGGGEA